MKQRYQIIQDYFGKFYDKTIIATTNSLFSTVHICNNLNEALKDRPFDIDFKKIVTDVDDVLDFYPNEHLDDKNENEVYDCKTLKEFEEEYKKRAE